MRVVRSRLPIFFHRRLLLMVVAGLVAWGLLGARLAQLTLLEGGQLRAEAERAIRRERFLPTWRGSIVDRNGEVLAQDRASWSVAVPFEVISGGWAEERALLQARKDLGSDIWDALGPEERGKAILKRLPEWDRLVDRLFDGLATLTPLERVELDQRREAVRQSISRMVVHVHARQRARFQARQEEEPGKILGNFERRPLAEQLAAHVLVTEVDDDTAFEILRVAESIEQEAVQKLGVRDAGEPIVELVDGQRRERPWASVTLEVPRSSFPRTIRSSEPASLLMTGVADHILGTVRDRVLEEDLYRRPMQDPTTGELIDRGGYRAGADMIGARGVEASREDQLRGHIGIKYTNLETGEVEIDEPSPGEDVELTIDIRLQARVQALLDPRLGLSRVQQYHAGWQGESPVDLPLEVNTPLDGAIVVVDVETGEILAMASSPTVAEGGMMDAGQRATHAPFVHRAVEATYPPGSIVKPLLYVAAVTEGTIDVDERVDCTGHYYENIKDRARCWIYRQRYGFANHTDRLGGALDASDALTHSCNIYFYHLAEHMGMDLTAKWFREFGLDEPLDVGLLYERDVVSTSEGGERRFTRRRFAESGGNVPDSGASPIALGIGQGELTWSPVQAANAYATLARGGIVRDATLLKNPQLRGERRTGDLGLDEEAVATALSGLRRVVSDDAGTGRWLRFPGGRDAIIDVPNVAVWGKTGTAEAPPLRIDVDGDGFLGGPEDRKISGLDHAWFVGLAGEASDEKPRYAIAVLLEYGGSGGRAAGPIAAEVIRALVEEGYLSGENDGGAS